MKNLVIILFAVLISFTAQAKDKKERKEKREVKKEIKANESREQIPNLVYETEVGVEALADLNFYGEYFRVLPKTEYEAKLYRLKNNEFSFWEDSYNLVDGETKKVTKVSADTLYQLVRFKNIAEGGALVAEIEFSCIDANIPEGIEVRNGVYQYSKLETQIPKVTFGEETFYVYPISQNYYKYYVGTELGKEYAYIFIKEKEAEVLMYNGDTHPTVKSKTGIYIMKDKTKLLVSDILY